MEISQNITGWTWVLAYDYACKQALKAETDIPVEELPDYVLAIAKYTAEYEQLIRAAWLEFKRNPDPATAQAFADMLVNISSERWAEWLPIILGVDSLSSRQQEHLDELLRDHHNYILTSLLPDILRNIENKDQKTIVEDGLLDSLDHRAIFLYAGAFWSAGFLFSIAYDGLNVRDLMDLFMFIGPQDERTCTGARGCSQHVGKIYAVFQILADDIIPGHLNCLTSCRHILLPVASPLTEQKSYERADKHKQGQHDQTTHGRRGARAEAHLATSDVANYKIAGKTGQEWLDEQILRNHAYKVEALAQFDKEGATSEMSRDAYISYMDRLGDHRLLITNETLRVAKKRDNKMTDQEKGNLMSNLQVHDRDKFDWNVAEAYVGAFQIDRKTYEGAFTAAMTNHHLKNPHHWEYHVTSETVGGKTMKRANPIPRTQFVEMIGDWNGTAREKNMPTWAYYSKFGNRMILHPETRAAAEREIGYKRPQPKPQPRPKPQSKPQSEGEGQKKG